MRALVAIALLATLAAPAAADNRSAVGTATHVRGMCSNRQGYNVSSIPSSLKSWWNAEDSSRITQSSNAVSSWVDETDTYTLAQSTAGNKPTLVAAGSGAIGGAQHVDFDGGDYISRDAATGTGSLGEIWVAYDYDGAGANQALWSEANNSTTTYTLSYCQGATNNKPSGAWRGSGIVNVWLPTSATTSVNTSIVTRNYSTDTAYVLEINGVSAALTLSSGSNDGSWWADTGNSRSAIGCYYNHTTGQFFNGQVYAVILIDGANLTTAEAAGLRAYLAGAIGATYP